MTHVEHGEISTSPHIHRYFNKFSNIFPILIKVATETGVDGWENTAIFNELVSLNQTFTMLSKKYMTAVAEKPSVIPFQIDAAKSGFPAAQIIRELQVDQNQAKKRLSLLGNEKTLKENLLTKMLQEKIISSSILSELSEVHYLNSILQSEDLFFIRNPIHICQASDKENLDGTRRYTYTWSVYDSQINLPVIYTMVADQRQSEMNGKIDELKKQLYSLSLSSMKMVTIASNIDKKFPHLHPKSLKRIFIGPLYSNAYTSHNNHISEILKYNPIGRDWLLSWTTESIFSKSQEKRSNGMWGSQLREVYAVDIHDKSTMSSGTTSTETFMILPYESYQALNNNPDNPLTQFRKFVTCDNNHILYNL